ncbi:MAG: HAMP domain-containing histidine kinase [Proteobacteria bacterium]|nr:HAMP domain-containing histidine kinase [Pseudomonadota bacterium]
MKDLEEQLLSLVASQGELVGSITHDIKGLLSGVEGGIYLVNSGLKKDKKERVAKGFEMMQRSLGRIQRTVASALYYVKDREIDWQSIDAQELVSSVSNALLEQANHLGIVLKVKAEACSFDADEFAVHSLLVNLVEYSIGACELAKLKPSPSVSLSANVSNEYATFDVFVDGFTMDDETKGHALGQFYSPKGIDRSHLGVFIARKIAQNHHGTFEITSLPDEGTTRFVIKFPALKPAESLEEGDSSEQDRLAREWDGD